MGTRNLICVVQGGEYRVAQYSQWDGYPSGQGQGIVEFLLRPGTVKALKQAALRVRHLTREEVKARWDTAGLDESQFLSKYARAGVMHLDRDCGAKILDYLIKATEPEVYMSLEFAGDSLFCEYAYVVDLDADRLEIYRGFCKAPTTGERFSGFERFQDEHTRASGYAAVRFWKSFAFGDLSLLTMQQLEDEAAE